MAYDKSKVFQPQPAGTSTVLAGNESDLQKKEQGLGAGVQPTTSGGSVTGGVSSQVNQNKPVSTASKGSGSFTNLQSYISKNQPQAQKTSDTLARSSEGQAAQVGQAIQSKQNQADINLETNKDIAGRSYNQAGDVLSNVGRELTQEEKDNFRNFTQGNMGLQDVNLDLFNEQQRSEALQKLARRTGTQEGLGQMLGSTIGKNRQYTQGQSSLDNLILSGTQSALTSLRDRALDSADSLQGTTRQAMDKFSTDKGQFETDLENNQKSLVKETEKLVSDIENPLKLKVEEKNKQLNDSVNELTSFNKNIGMEDGDEMSFIQDQYAWSDVSKYIKPEDYKKEYESAKQVAKSDSQGIRSIGQPEFNAIMEKHLGRGILEGKSEAEIKILANNLRNELNNFNEKTFQNGILELANRGQLQDVRINPQQEYTLSDLASADEIVSYNNLADLLGIENRSIIPEDKRNRPDGVGSISLGKNISPRWKPLPKDNRIIEGGSGVFDRNWEAAEKGGKIIKKGEEVFKDVLTGSVINTPIKLPEAPKVKVELPKAPNPTRGWRLSDKNVKTNIKQSSATIQELLNKISQKNKNK